MRKQNNRLNRLLASWAFSNFALWAWAISIATISFQQLGSLGVAMVLVARLLPSALASPIALMFASNLQDEWSLKLSKLVRIGAMGLAAVCLWLEGPFWVFCIAVVIEGLGSGPMHALHMHAMPNIARDPHELAKANKTTEIIRAGSLIVGPAIAAVSFFAGTTLLALVVCMLLVASAYIVLGVTSKTKGQANIEGGSYLLARFMAGVSTAWNRPKVLLLVLLSIMCGLVSGALQLFLTAVAVDLLAWGRPGPGLLLAVVGIGGLVGGMISLKLVSGKQVVNLPMLGLFVIGGSTVIFGIFTMPIPVLMSCLLGGAGLSILLVSTNALMLRTVLSSDQPAIFGLTASLQFAGVGMGGIVASGLVGLFGLSEAPWMFGILLLLISIYFWILAQSWFSDMELFERELEVVQNNELLKTLPVGPALQVATSLRMLEFETGSNIMRKGDKGDAAFIIEDGVVTVEIDGADVASLKQGDLFGEIALLNDVPRTATVTAATKLCVWRLNRDSFLYALSNSNDCFQTMFDLAYFRLGRNADLADRTIT